MSLQFDPSPYLAAFKAQQERTPTGSQIAGQIGQGLNSLGDTALELSKDARQKKLQTLMAGYKAQEQGDDPMAAMSFMGYGQRTPSNAPSLPPEQGNALMPSMRPGQGLEASAGVSDAPRMPQPSGSPTPITQSPVIAAWNKSKGVQSPQAPGLFTRKPFDVNGVLAQLKNGDASAIANLNDKQMKQLEATPAYIQMKKKDDMRTPGQVGALFPHLDPAALAREYPNGIPKEDLAFISSGLKADVTQGDKADQFYQKEWDKIVKQTDPLTATSRSTLGLATRADYNANRALTTLSKPMVTNQEASNVMADIASIYQNGSATQFGMSHQAYDTLYGKVQSALQMVSGNPQDALPDAIKQRLVGVLQDMKGTNQAVLKQAFDSIEKSQPKVISHFANEWKGLRGNYEQGISGGPEAKPLYATNGKQRIMSTDGGQTWQPAK